MFFSVTTMNLNWEILTKTLVTFFLKMEGIKDGKLRGELGFCIYYIYYV